MLNGLDDSPWNDPYPSHMVTLRPQCNKVNGHKRNDLVEKATSENFSVQCTNMIKIFLNQ